MKPESAAEVKVTAFDYYDGATEGFAENLLDDSEIRLKGDGGN